MCEYKFRSGEKCGEEALKNSKYCILHIHLPEDEESEEFKRINKLKEEKVKEKVNKGDFNFWGAELFKVNFSAMKTKYSIFFIDAVIRTDVCFNRAEIGGDTNFNGVKIGGNVSFNAAKIDGDAWFNITKISGNAWFGGAKIGRNAWFRTTKIRGGASFDGAEIGEDALFDGAKIGINAHFDRIKIRKDASFDAIEIDGSAWFGRAKIGRDANFNAAKIGGNALFDGAKIGRDASFNGAKIDRGVSFGRAKIGGDASFDKAEISRDVRFHLTEVKGKLSFKNARFTIPEAQEEACRKAKRICEELGDREEADYYFYREMEAKCKQKNWFKRLLELPLQYIFGYGTKWERVLITWFVVVFGCALLFWVGNGIEANTLKTVNSLWENIYFSIVTATTLGYGDYHPKSGFYQVLASLEAIFGTFMWAAFIVIFARKYMR